MHYYLFIPQWLLDGLYLFQSYALLVPYKMGMLLSPNGTMLLNDNCGMATKNTQGYLLPPPSGFQLGAGPRYMVHKLLPVLMVVHKFDTCMMLMLSPWLLIRDCCMTICSCLYIHKVCLHANTFDWWQLKLQLSLGATWS